jgi:hypothetical protein
VSKFKSQVNGSIEDLVNGFKWKSKSTMDMHGEMIEKKRIVLHTRIRMNELALGPFPGFATVSCPKSVGVGPNSSFFKFAKERGKERVTIYYLCI